jgi:large subunit ribosomal protein L18
MSLLKKIKLRRVRKEKRIRSKIRLLSNNNKFRISVFRSSKNFYAQMIDDKSGKTLLSIDTRNVSKNTKKCEASKIIGIEFAKNILKDGIKDAIFDRGRYLYHGRVKEFVEGLRHGGLKI